MSDKIPTMQDYMREGRPRKPVQKRLPPWLKKKLPLGDPMAPVRKILEKLHLQNRAELAAFGVREGLVPPD